MEHTPSEIWTKIFAHACTDSGETGRQLSRVSRFTRAPSAPVKLQSIAAHGPRQIMAFRRLLLQTPPPVRRTKYLLLSIALPISQEALGQILEAGRDILTAVADSVEILYLDAPQDLNIWDFPTPFPRLVELASHSFPPSRRMPHAVADQDTAPLPQLRRCYFMCTGPPGISQGALCGIFITAPALTHLRFSNLGYYLTDPLPESIQLVYVKLGVPPLYYTGAKKPLHQSLMGRLEDLSRIDHRLVLLPAYIVDDAEWRIATSEWEERISGGDGCWSLRERIVADSNVPASDFSSSEDKKDEISSTAV